jgi:DNA-binding transcriptional MerR regulator
LEEIAELLQLSRAGVAPCSRVTALARQHLARLDERLKRLTAFRRQLDRACASWEDGRCGFTAKGLCELIEVADSPYPDEQAPTQKKRRRR